ncbi:DUF4105 domain-containing protein [Parabacteroides sp. OttesenSCG-928-N08]|nr:DUF4105 domain-containing protein [Parabacteroides sp. OttesenSCG-928-N08]
MKTDKLIKSCGKVALLCWLMWLASLSAQAQRPLSDEAFISVLTSAPYEGEVFTLYGHAAFRVSDPVAEMDYVFNYGIFDFTKPNFVWRFALGHTDYKLGVNKYAGYLNEYLMRGSDVTEQVLNLTNDEKQRIWQALVENAKPENATYRYNFFFDNCATRLPAILEKFLSGEIVYNDPPTSQTFRQMISHCTRNHPWLTFGCDLALGAPTDRMATPHEMMFLPEYVKIEFSKATILDAEGNSRPLVKDTIVSKAYESDEARKSLLDIFTPLVCGILLLLLVGVVSFWEIKKRRRFVGLDVLLFGIAGIAGVVLFFLCFISEHPSISPNWSIVWLHPFHLLAVVLFCVKKGKKAAFYYHFINFAALLLFLLAWILIPQELNRAFIPLILLLAGRSLLVLMTTKDRFIACAN